MIFNSCSDALSLGSARNGTKFATENRRSLSASVLQRSVHKLISIDISIYVIESESLKQLFLLFVPMVCVRIIIQHNARLRYWQIAYCNSCSDGLSLGSARSGTKFATENRRSLSTSVFQWSA